ncbi:MAG TPA: zf-HC2 domain-containing protein [Myxococcota bacterium]|nr:zf-HC2 domain-containing protein [Myxococcota bacterium]
MRHRRARRLVTGLLDGGIDAATRRSLESHVRECRACQRSLDEHGAVESLLRLLPSALVPYEASPSAQRRLWGLARWSERPGATWRERFGLGALAVGAAAMAAALWISSGTWSESSGASAAALVLAQAAPDASSSLPLGWR